MQASEKAPEGGASKNGSSAEKGAAITDFSFAEIYRLVNEASAGKLSAFCGCGIAGGTGLASALSLMMGGDEEAAAEGFHAMCPKTA